MAVPSGPRRLFFAGPESAVAMPGRAGRGAENTGAPAAAAPPSAACLIFNKRFLKYTRTSGRGARTGGGGGGLVGFACKSAAKQASRGYSYHTLRFAASADRRKTGEEKRLQVETYLHTESRRVYPSVHVVQHRLKR